MEPTGRPIWFLEKIQICVQNSSGFLVTKLARNSPFQNMVGTENGLEKVCPFSPLSLFSFSQGSYLVLKLIYYSRFVQFMKERECFFVKMS